MLFDKFQNRMKQRYRFVNHVRVNWTVTVNITDLG